MQKQPLPSSYRDPAGFVFTEEHVVYRQINKIAQSDYELFMQSGLYEKLVAERLIVSHTERKSMQASNTDLSNYKIIRPENIPFISYPYEWSFAQLRDAALLTLKIQKLALEHGMILKDASAYNVQFIGKTPLFIDTLSFAKYEDGQAWEGYRQFCEHFITPLIIAHYATDQSLRMLQTYMDGVPLGFAVRILPPRAKLKKGIYAHVYLHERSQRRHQGSGTKSASAPTRKVSRFALNGLMASLEACVRALTPPKNQTEWGEYYQFTNYNDRAFKNKAAIVDEYLGRIKQKPKMVWDIGANNGEFSELAAKRGAYTVAWDIDSKAVAKNYNNKDTQSALMLPLVQDIAMPSPSIGWELKERFSFIDRGPADVVLALAVVHHLAIGRNVPLPKIAEMFAGISQHLIIEFIPKEDSKVQHLLASRKDIFPQYSQNDFETAMEMHFTCKAKKQIKQSKRWMYLYSK